MKAKTLLEIKQALVTPEGYSNIHELMSDNSYVDIEIAFDKVANQFAQNRAELFAEWINKNRYSKYFGNDSENNHKWYIQFPNSTQSLKPN